MGDFNIAPRDEDVYDIEKFVSTTHTTKREREALENIIGLGFIDAYRELYPDVEGFTYWDYRNGDFNNNRGLRIDLALVSESLKPRIRNFTISRESRIGDSPSDHAAIMLELGGITLDAFNNSLFSGSNESKTLSRNCACFLFGLTSSLCNAPSKIFTPTSR